MGKAAIIACDFKDKNDTLEFLKKFSDEKLYLKIGMELFYGAGGDIVREVKAAGHSVFLDLKLHDIPTTVRKAMTNLAKLGVDMVNVHAAGTRAMMEAALVGLKDGCQSDKTPILLAVTILTSIDGTALHNELLINEELNNTVAKYAENAKLAGLNGVVCSPLETALVKATCGKEFVTVTPGIRFADNNVNDQKRIMTPADAKAIGTDYIVVGRAVTAAADVKAAYKRVCEDFLD